MRCANGPVDRQARRQAPRHPLMFRPGLVPRLPAVLPRLCHGQVSRTTRALSAGREAVRVVQAGRLKDHGRRMAAREGRPDQYFRQTHPKRRPRAPVGDARRDRGGAGLCRRDGRTRRTFSLQKREGSAFIQSARWKCLIRYYYFMDGISISSTCACKRGLPAAAGLCEGHEWLARKLTPHAVRYRFA
jgi:hypothetical protein